MKIKSLLIGMLASTAFVACTNDESPVNNEQAVVGGEKQYVAVNIVTPGSVNGRATAEDFAQGEPNEVKVKDAVFLFLNRNYEGCANPYYISNFGDWDAEGAGVGQDKQKRVLVIDGAKKDEVPAYIVAVLNPSDYSNTNYSANTTLAQLKTRYANYSGVTTNLVMSNAVYFDGTTNKEVAATPITLENIVSDKNDLAKDTYKPITIQVERVVGKVIVNQLANAIADLNANGLKETIDDQENLKLEFVLTGWNVLQNNQSSLIKNVDATKWTIKNWNDAALMRSYWANDYTVAGRTSYKVADADKLTNTEFKYVEETVNQNATKVDALNNLSPYLLVTGKFVKKGTAGTENEEAVDLVEWRGNKYTAEGYLNFIAGNPEISQYYTATTTGEGDAADTKYTSFSADLLKLQDNEENDWGATAVLKNENTEFYTVTFEADGKSIDKATKVTVAEGQTNPVVAAIAKFGEVQYWNGGNTYYFVPIQHEVFNATDKTNHYGVVRNHIYKMNITKMSGYGTPVADPNDAIDQPEKPTIGDTYLAADIVVLDWRVISNDVTLGE